MTKRVGTFSASASACGGSSLKGLNTTGCPSELLRVKSPRHHVPQIPIRSLKRPAHATADSPTNAVDLRWTRGVAARECGARTEAGRRAYLRHRPHFGSWPDCDRAGRRIAHGIPHDCFRFAPAAHFAWDFGGRGSFSF